MQLHFLVSAFINESYYCTVDVAVFHFLEDVLVIEGLMRELEEGKSSSISGPIMATVNQDQCEHVHYVILYQVVYY